MAGKLTAAQRQELRGIMAKRSGAGSKSDGFNFNGKPHKSVSGLSFADRKRIAQNPDLITPTLNGKPLQGDAAKRSRRSYLAHLAR